MSLKRIGLIITIIIGIGTVVGIGAKLDGRWAKAEDVKQLEKRLDQKILEDRADNLRSRMWKLEDRYGVVMPPEAREEHRELGAEREKVIRELDKLNGKAQ